MKQTNKRLTGWLATCTLCATLVAAPETESVPVELEPVDVPPVRRIEFQGKLESSTSAYTRVGKAGLERALPRSLEEMVGLAPGVRARSRAGDDVFLSIRGSGIQSVVFTKARGTDLLIDGLPVNSADGNFDYSLISPLDISSIDIMRGGFTGYGSNTLGGAINIHSPTGRDMDGGLVRVDAGSFGFLRGSVAYGTFGDDWDIAVRYTHQRQDGFRDYSSGDSHKLSTNYGYRLSDVAENRFYVNMARVHQQVALPISRAKVKADPSQAGTLNPATRPYFDVDTLRIADKITYADGNVSGDLGLFYLYRDVDFRRPSMPPTGFLMGPGWLDAKTHDFGGQGRVAYEGELFGRRNTLSGGVRAGYLSGTEKLYPNLATVRGPMFANGDLSAWNTSIWVENDHALTDRLALILGVKAAYAYREYKDNFYSGPASQSGSHDYSAISPKVGLRWDVTEKANVFASLGRSFEPPAFGDLIAIPIVPPPPQRIAFRSLKAQEATTLEIGTRGEEGPYTWEVSLYRSWIDDEILRYDDGTQTGNQVGRNAGKTIHDGLELGFGVRLWQNDHEVSGTDLQRLTLRGAYVWNNYRYDNDPVYGSNHLAGIPVQTLAAELLYEYAGYYIGVNVGSNLQSYSADNANTWHVNQVFLFGARAGWRGERLSVYIDARNLTDKSYVAGLQNGTNLRGADADIFFPGAGRSVYAGIEWRW